MQALWRCVILSTCCGPTAMSHSPSRRIPSRFLPIIALAGAPVRGDFLVECISFICNEIYIFFSSIYSFISQPRAMTLLFFSIFTNFLFLFFWFRSFSRFIFELENAYSHTRTHGHTHLSVVFVVPRLYFQISASMKHFFLVFLSLRFVEIPRFDYAT